MAQSNKNVAYFYDEQIGNFCYGGGNPMRPHRARMVFSLVSNYGLGKQMVVYRPEPRSFTELTEYHADDYINFIKSVCPNNVDEYMTQLRRFNMGLPGEADCPVFDGLFQYCQAYSGGSVDGASWLAQKKADIAFNWSGGMHHAKKAEASGFCYVNDIVLAILELLKVFPRVLYVDIDIHHGDGVEEAFYLTDRVMTVSFHKYGEFFPGTGALDDIGTQKGKGYTVNVPLKDGMDDTTYQTVYEPIMAKVMEMYQPEAIVMCCGADSLSGDKLGCFNLSMEGHSHCLEFMSKYNVPMLVLGGGGYTLRNVARCWCYETGRMMGIDLPDNLPEAALDEFNYYLDTGRLRIAVSNMKNANTAQELEVIKLAVLQHLSSLPPVPSAHMAYCPPLKQRDDLPEQDLDARGGGQIHDEHRRVKPADDSDDEDGEEVVGRRPLSVEPPAASAADADAASNAPADPAAAHMKAEPMEAGPSAAGHLNASTPGGGDYEAASLHTSEALKSSSPKGAEPSAAAAPETAQVLVVAAAPAAAEPPANLPPSPPAALALEACVETAGQQLVEAEGREGASPPVPLVPQAE